MPITVPLCIVVGLDLSDTASDALLAGRRLAAGLAARLEIVHVAEAGGADDKTAEAEVRIWLNAHGGIADDIVLLRGLPWLELLRHAADSHASVLVVGSHGRSGVQPMMLGSTAAKLALAAPCPVMVVGPRATRSHGADELSRVPQ